MLRLLRLPCALLALLLSALGGPRFAVDRPDEDKPQAPMVAALALPPVAPIHVDPPGDWWCPELTAGGWSRPVSAAPCPALACTYPAPAQPVPGPRRGSAGGPRAP